LQVGHQLHARHSFDLEPPEGIGVHRPQPALPPERNLHECVLHKSDERDGGSKRGRNGAGRQERNQLAVVSYRGGDPYPIFAQALHEVLAPRPPRIDGAAVGRVKGFASLAMF
jgi:hypothetical protein